MSPSTDDAGPVPLAELQRRAISGSVWTAVNTIVYLPTAFVANAIIARHLGVVSYGHLAFLTAAFALAFPLANLGVSTAFLQRGSRAEAAGRRRESDGLLRRSLGFHLAIELPILVVIAAALTWGDPLWEVMAIGTVVLLTCVLSGGVLSMIIENRTAAGAKLAMATNLFVQGAVVSAALLTSSASAVWATRAFVPALALAANFAFLDRSRRRIALRPRLPTALGRDFWRFAILSWAASIVGLLVFSRSEIFLLRAVGKTEALGLFALAFGLSQQMTAPADALLQPLLPAIAGIVSSWPERALRAFERSTRVSALVCGGIAATVVPTLVFAIPLVYGAEFKAASWLLVPLALVSIFQSVNNPVVAFMNARQRAGLRLKASVVALVVNVVVALALIPRFGAWGAVIANALGQLIVIAWLALTEPLAMHRGLRGLFELHRSFIVGLVSLAIAVAAGSFAQHWSSSLAVVTAWLTGALAYLTGVRLSGSGLTSEDRNALVVAMPPPMRLPLGWLLRPVTSSAP